MRIDFAVVVCGLVALAGCSGGVVGGNQSEGSQQAGVAGSKLTGVVHGGQNPISGAQVYLFAAASGASGAGQAAYGGNGIAASATNASVSLLTNGINTLITPVGDPLAGDYYVTTGSDGSFSISGDYTCTAGQQLYLFTLGGDPGLGTGVNPAAGLMAALGSCPGTAGSTGNTLSSGLYVVVNEVSTVAAAYVMAGFATDATHIGSSGTTLAQTGIANAFANAGNLETPGTGAALATTPAGNGTVPQAEIYTLANILASCVNSDGTASACTTLFANATVDGTSTGAQPTDTATAAINIAHHPGANVATLYGLSMATPAFGGGLTSAPNDFALSLQFSGGGLIVSFGLAVDGDGNVWVANACSYCGVTEVSSTGSPISPPEGYLGGGLSGVAAPEIVAIDSSGNAWVAITVGSKTVFGEFSGTGTVLSPSSGYDGPLEGFDSGNLIGVDIAFDPSGELWANNLMASTLSSFNPSNNALPLGGTYTGGGLQEPTGVAIDGEGNIWAVNVQGNSLSKFSNSGVAISPGNGFTGGGLDGPSALAIDAGENVWVTNNYTFPPSINKFSNSGVAFSSTGYSGGGVCAGQIAVDGAGNVWVACGHIAEFSNNGVALSPSTGLMGNGGGTGQIAVDGSGDVWVTNPGSDDYSLREFVGAGVPVVTPTVTAVKNNMLGARP